MKIESKKLEKCQVRLHVTLDAEEAGKAVKEVEKAFVREVRMPGFRPGHVPIEKIRRTHSEALASEIQRRIVSGALGKAIEQEKLASVGVSSVDGFERGTDGASFTAIVEVRPEFKLPEYKGLSIPAKDATVTDAQLDETFEGIRASYAKFEDAKEGETAAKGDFVQITYSGAMDGKPLSEIVPDEKIVSGSEGYWTQIEEGRFLPEILAALEGMKAGETKEGVKAMFPKGAAPAALEEKEAEYKVALVALRKRILPGDGELAGRLGASSIDEARAQIREKMQKRADDAEKARRLDAAADILLEKCDFDVPSIVVSRVKDAFLAEYANRAQASGLPAEYFEKNRDKIESDAAESAEKYARLQYIYEAIAKAENIEASGGDAGAKVLEFILANAK